MPFGNAGDQVGGPGERQRGRKACDDRHYLPLPLPLERLQGFINRSLVEPPPGDADVPASRIRRGRDLDLAQWVPHPHDANETVSEQCLRTQLRASGLPHDTRFQIGGSVVKWRAVFICPLHETQSHARSFLADARNEVRSEVLHKAFTGVQRETFGLAV